ncbi:D-glycero-beta-D-manno-heptose-7-phosphate kinase [Buchnera aphidicola (Neophyllaphis podocarpi)]|uniref:D-glycero-beta-D-manno-heptose-7-phosphate kinase n=1 Tax=Buchnera aphidicola TaxID=9 RepID=UPI0031B8A601
MNIYNSKKVKIMIVGDIMLDKYWQGNIGRKSPEAQVPVVKINNSINQPGGAANVAMNIASLGKYSKLIGITGNDNNALILKKILHKRIINNIICISKYKTITKLRILSDNKQIIRIDFEENFNKFNNEIIYKKIKKSIKNIKIVILSDYNKGTLNNIKKIINLTQKMCIPILIDPKGADFKKYYGATILTPNLNEFELIVGKCKNENKMINKGMKLIRNLNLSALLITKSKEGMTLLQKNKKPVHFNAISKEALDVTGAGDTVISMIAISLINGNTLEQACFKANIAASMVVNKFGTSTVTNKEFNKQKNLIIKKDKKNNKK